MSTETSGYAPKFIGKLGQLPESHYEAIDQLFGIVSYYIQTTAVFEPFDEILVDQLQQGLHSILTAACKTGLLHTYHFDFPADLKNPEYLVTIRFTPRPGDPEVSICTKVTAEPVDINAL